MEKCIGTTMLMTRKEQQSQCFACPAYLVISEVSKTVIKAEKENHFSVSNVPYQYNRPSIHVELIF